MLDDLTDKLHEETRADRRPQRRWWRRILAVLVAVVLLVGVGVGGYLLFLNQTVAGNVKHDNLLPDQAAPGSAPGGSGTAAKPRPPAGRGMNILFLGSDARPGDTASRSDVIVLMHITADKHTVYLVHFPRDLYVPIPGHGKNKINAAFAFGGSPLLVQTLQDLLNVRVDHVALTDFEGFKKMTDAVGGIRVWAEEASNGSGNGGPVVINKGWNDLNGEEALGFVRERYTLSEGDISRGRRQQAFIKALMLKALSRETLTNPVTLAKFVNAGTENLTVDKGFSLGEMRSEAFSLRSIRGGDVVFITAPFDGFGRAPDGGSIDIVNDADMKELGDSIRKDSLANYESGPQIP